MVIIVKEPSYFKSIIPIYGKEENICSKKKIWHCFKHDIFNTNKMIKRRPDLKMTNEMMFNWIKYERKMI